MLADEMGLGKTVQAIRGIDLLVQKGELPSPRILVLCPAVARLNWAREFVKFSSSSIRLTPILATPQKLPSGSVVTSYDLVSLKPTIFTGPWDILILDEAHFLKSPEARRTKSVLGKRGVINASRRVWALTGTPAPNHAAELWPLLYTFGTTPLSYSSFIERYCTFYEDPKFGKRITGTKASTTPELRRVLAPVMMRRKKADVLRDLPPITFGDVVVEPGPVDLRAESSFTQYIFPTDRTAELEAKLASERELVTGIFAKAGGTRDGMRAFEALASSVSTLRRYTGIQKVQGVADLVSEELKSKAYDKVVIFAIHRDVIEGLRQKLSKFKPVTLYGGTDPSTRDKNIRKFQTAPKTRVFIGNIQACGTAITLTAAHQVIFAEQDWVPGNNAQAAMRCHRVGQTKPVTVRVVALANSIDEKIAFVLKRKMREITKIVDEADAPEEFDSAESDSSLRSENRAAIPETHSQDLEAGETQGVAE